MEHYPKVFRDSGPRIFGEPKYTNAKIDYTTSGPDTNERFWAMQDVSFDVYLGEIVSIIGRNDAGKSKMLTILSQVTTSTT